MFNDAVVSSAMQSTLRCRELLSDHWSSVVVSRVNAANSKTASRSGDDVDTAALVAASYG